MSTGRLRTVGLRRFACRCLPTVHLLLSLALWSAMCGPFVCMGTYSNVRERGPEWVGVCNVSALALPVCTYPKSPAELPGRG